jgi:hypothetical protein
MWWKSLTCSLNTIQTRVEGCTLRQNKECSSTLDCLAEEAKRRPRRRKSLPKRPKWKTLSPETASRKMASLSLAAQSARKRRHLSSPNKPIHLLLLLLLRLRMFQERRDPSANAKSHKKNKRRLVHRCRLEREPRPHPTKRHLSTTHLRQSGHFKNEMKKNHLKKDCVYPGCW